MNLPLSSRESLPFSTQRPDDKGSLIRDIGHLQKDEIFTRCVFDANDTSLDAVFHRVIRIPNLRKNRKWWDNHEQNHNLEQNQ